MTKTVPPVKECPAFEEISAFFDGEECIPGVKEHIAVCPECARKIEELKKLSASVCSSFPEPDEAFSELMLLKVRKSLKNNQYAAVSKPDFRYGAFLIRAAAFLILAGAFTFYVWDRSRTEEHVNTINPGNVEHSAMIPSTLTAVPAERKNISGVDASDFATVSFGPDSRLPEIPGKKAQQWEAIPDRIYHTWKLAPGYGEKQLTDMVRSIGGCNTVVRKKSGDILELRFQAGKLQSVQFVRNCRKAGNKLLSPGQPQPEQERFTGSANDPVTYTGEFYRK